MPFGAEVLVLTREEREELQQMTQSRTLPAGDVMRSRMVLLLADGVPYRKIQDLLDTTAPTIARWKERFPQQRGPDGGTNIPARSLRCGGRSCGQRCWPRSRKGRKGVPRAGRVENWRAASASAKIPFSGFWPQADVRPHRLERYMASDDPDFEIKAA